MWGIQYLTPLVNPYNDHPLHQLLDYQAWVEAQIVHSLAPRSFFFVNVNALGQNPIHSSYLLDTYTDFMSVGHGHMRREWRIISLNCFFCVNINTQGQIPNHYRICHLSNNLQKSTPSQLFMLLFHQNWHIAMHVFPLFFFSDIKQFYAMQMAAYPERNSQTAQSSPPLFTLVSLSSWEIMITTLLRHIGYVAGAIN